MQIYTVKLFIAFKMVYFCCFSIGQNLDFTEFLRKKFYNINYKSHLLHEVLVCYIQCDPIRRFISLWTTFLSLWQQLLCPNCEIFRQFFKCVKIIHFSSEIIFGPLFMDIWLFFTGHIVYLHFQVSEQHVRVHSDFLLASNLLSPIAPSNEVHFPVGHLGSLGRNLLVGYFIEIRISRIFFRWFLISGQFPDVDDSVGINL